jgi:hypothetical protein
MNHESILFTRSQIMLLKLNPVVFSKMIYYKIMNLDTETKSSCFSETIYEHESTQQGRFCAYMHLWV